MKRKIKVNYFVQIEKWSKKLIKIKRITKNTINEMEVMFLKNYDININLILSGKKDVSKLNKIYKNKSGDTDVLTFVNKISNKQLGKILYCDIFFSINTIEKFVIENDIDFYDHFNHLLIHSILHINGYKHDNRIEFDLMKNKEIEIMKDLGLDNPYKR
tara:strand:+ start:302 stop:778 length:477 start_codon:yes stop_codon:yes gene_type:complete